MNEKRKNFWIVAIVAALVLAVGGIMMLSSKQTEKQIAGEHLKVAATIFPIYDIAKNIAGEHVEVVLILPPGSSPHTFTVTPAEIKKLSGVKTIFMAGVIDEWAKTIGMNVSGAESFELHNGIELKESSGEHEHESEENPPASGEGAHAHESDFDPHYWLSAQNAIIIASNITETMKAIDPENEKSYEENLADYAEKLRAMDQDIRNILSEIPDKKIITFHDSWGYFADSYGIQIIGTFEPSPGKEPTPAYMQNIFSTAKASGIKAIFSEPQLPSSALRPFVEDLGLKLYVLDPLGGEAGRDSYISMMMYNANIIKEALSE